MRIELVTAHAFGALEEQSLELAPGLNIVFGANESGKSTWHAAIYAGLCGVRRSRGGARKEDREFERQRRPWSTDAWAVSARIVLADGRTIELRHDLDGGVDCRATDVTLGRDVSAEIMSDGAPDAARWLGLDRRSFLQTACVRQTDVLGVLADPERLQQHLQRAAASGDADETAAAAIERLDAFARERVGQDRRNATRPLRRAVEAEATAGGALDVARAAHAELLELSVRSDEAAERARVAEDRGVVVRAARAAERAALSRGRLERAAALERRHSQGPPRLVDDEALARSVSAALRQWETRPSPPAGSDGSHAALTGPDVEALRAELASLPAAPAGELEPDPAVEALAAAYEDARRAVELHREQRPADPPPELVRQVTSPAQQPKGPLRTLGGLGAAAFGAAALGGGIVVLLLRPDDLVTAIGLIAVGGVSLAWSLFGSRSDRVSIEMRELEAELGSARLALEHWQRRDTELAATVARSAAELASVLRDRDVASSDGPAAAFARYRSDCAARRALADRAARAPELARQIEAHELLERASAAATRGAEQAARALREAGEACGLDVPDLVEGTDGDDGLERLVESLLAWQARRAELLEAHETARKEYAELEALLDGRTLGELASEVEHHERAARELGSGTGSVPGGSGSGGSEWGEIETGTDLESELAQREEELAAAAKEASSLAGQLAERGRALPSVSEAEEAHARACDELAKVRELGRVLDRTREFLMRAQERVHRDIAPQLAATVRPHLSRVTAGRYVDVAVDPETLDVSVDDGSGRWPRAVRLSHGTAEVVYLLLRAALATHLTRAPEVCPLLLDDVTVQCDRERTERVLALLQELAGERQIVLLSQEEEVLRWAASRLDPGRDRLIRLDATR